MILKGVVIATTPFKYLYPNLYLEIYYEFHVQQS